MLYGTFELVSVFSYFIAVYYLITTMMLFQSYFYIQAIVNRRIALMRRRDLQEETGQQQPAINEDDDQMTMSGIFGGFISVPLPIPEILSTLDRTKYKEIVGDRFKDKKKEKKSNFDTVSE